HASRVGLSLLSAVGLRELAASTANEYVAAASGLALDPARRAELRRTLRERLLSSGLCDAAGDSGRLEAGLRRPWTATSGAPARTGEISGLSRRWPSSRRASATRPARRSPALCSELQLTLRRSGRLRGCCCRSA